MIQLLILFAIGEIGLPIALALGRNRLLFLPYAEPLPESAMGEFRHVAARVVRVVRPDGRKLSAYDVSPRGLAEDAPVVLFLHGNAGNIALRAGLAAWFAEKANVRLLLLGYTGYGGNEGRPSEDVPFSEGERLAAAQPNAEFLRVDGADHNDLFDIAGDDYLRGLGERFRRWTSR